MQDWQADMRTHRPSSKARTKDPTLGQAGGMRAAFSSPPFPPHLFHKRELRHSPPKTEPENLVYINEEIMTPWPGKVKVHLPGMTESRGLSLATHEEYPQVAKVSVYYYSESMVPKKLYARYARLMAQLKPRLLLTRKLVLVPVFPNY